MSTSPAPPLVVPAMCSVPGWSKSKVIALGFEGEVMLVDVGAASELAGRARAAMDRSRAVVVRVRIPALSTAACHVPSGALRRIDVRLADAFDLRAGHDVVLSVGPADPCLVATV